VDTPRLEHTRLNVTDLRRSVAWYEDVLGVKATGFWPDHEPVYAHFQAGPTQLGLSVLPPAPGGARWNFSVDDVDAWWARLQDKADVVEALYDTPYGSRKFTIRDPDGNELGFVRG
jgi:predicted enzyme related to lactoylglutathione lyase